MSFGRPRTTDTLNPFRNKFWTYANFFGVSQREQSAIEKAKRAIQYELSPKKEQPSPIFFNEQYKINDPVVSLDGCVFDRPWLIDYLQKNNNTHPVTKQKLYPSQLVNAPQLKALFIIQLLKKTYLDRVKRDLKGADCDEPDCLMCPISFVFFKQACITPHGTVYSLSEIKDHLRLKSFDPCYIDYGLQQKDLVMFPELDDLVQQFQAKRQSGKATLSMAS